MNGNALANTDGPPCDPLFIRRELLAVVLGQARTSAAGNLTVAGITGVVLFLFDRATATFWAWMVALVLLTWARLVFSTGILSRLPELDRTRIERHEHVLTALIALTGLSWGMLVWIGYTGENPFVDFYTVAVLLGMTGGGTALLAALPRALAIYLCTALLPTALRAIVVGGTVSLAGGAAALFAGFVLWNFGRSTHRSLIKSLHLTADSVRLGEALRRERDALAAAMRAKDLFQAGITHDLRQPVNALALHLHYLRSLKPAEHGEAEAAAAWSAAELSLQRISSQLTRLLDISQLESGAVQPTLEAVSVDKILAACHSHFSAHAAAKGLRLRVRATQLTTRSDVRMLQSILDNLVSNAIRNTEHGGVLIGIRRHGEHARICVYDTGCGIPAHIIPELFVAYRRFDDRTRDRKEGYGLGLVLVQRQAQLLGHEISVRSILERGSVFAVTVPVSGRAERGAPSLQ